MTRNENLARMRQAVKQGREHADHFPAVLYLEATASCNLCCPMCPTTMGLPRDPYRRDLFDLDLLPKLEKALPLVARAFLSGGGEPLLHPRFFHIVQALKSRRIEVIFNSNGTLLEEEASRQVLDTGVDTISFSIDGASKGTYESIRVGADFEEVMENVGRLARMKEEAGSRVPHMNMQFTVMDTNAHEIKQAADLAASIGINHLVVEPLTPVYCFDKEYDEFYAEHAVEPAKVIDDLKEASDRARKLGLVFSSHYLFAREHPEQARKCVQPWLTFGVRVDGRAFTCCGAIQPMGDLAEQSFDDIWNGPRYRSLRRALAKGEFPQFCTHCIRENRASHFNEDLVSEPDAGDKG